MLNFDSSHPIVTRGSRVSRAPPHHILPAFLNFNGSWSHIIILININKNFLASQCWKHQYCPSRIYLCEFHFSSAVSYQFYLKLKNRHVLNSGNLLYTTSHINDLYHTYYFEPSDPFIVMKTLASVPAQSRSPVRILITYVIILKNIRWKTCSEIVLYTSKVIIAVQIGFDQSFKYRIV